MTKTKNQKAKALLALYERDGHLTPESVVAEAKKKRSPLHSCFDWDDSTAAHKWRLEQAAFLIRKIKVEYTTPGHETIRVRAFTNIMPAAQGGEEQTGRAGVYITTQEALKSFQDQVLEVARREALALKNKYAALEKMAPIINAITAVFPE